MTVAVRVIAGFLARHRKLIVIIVITAIVVYAMFNSPQKKGKEEEPKGKGTVTTEERLKADIEALKKTVDEFKKKEEAKKSAEQEQTKQAETSPTSKNRGKEPEKTESLRELEKALRPQKPAQARGPQDGAEPFTETGLPVKKQDPPRLLKIDVSEINTAEKAEEKISGKQSDLFLPASSFASFTLTSSAYAPETGEQMPISGVLDKAFVGPNKSAVPLRGCYFLGKARGNTGAKFADVKAVKISCVWPDGRTFEADVAGYATDTNGDFGIKGRVERHAGTFFSTAGISSFLEGLSGGMARAQEQQSLAASGLSVQSATNVGGSAAAYGLLKGASDFSTAAKTFFDHQLQSLIPAVVVPAGTKGYIFITSGVTIPGGMSALKKSKSYYDNYNLSYTK
jgi:hypothetical protein